MIQKYSSMSRFLLHQAAEQLRGRHRRSIGIIRDKNGPTSLYLDIGRRPSQDGSLIIPPHLHALAVAAATAAGLLLLVFAGGSALYHILGRRR